MRTQVLAASHADAEGRVFVLDMSKEQHTPKRPHAACNRSWMLKRTAKENVHPAATNVRAVPQG